MATAGRSGRSHRAIDPRGDWIDAELGAAKPAPAAPATAAAATPVVAPAAAAPASAPPATVAGDGDKAKDKREKKSKKEKKDKEKKSKKGKPAGVPSVNGSAIAPAGASASIGSSLSPRAAKLDENTQKIEDRYRASFYYPLSRG